MALLSSPKVNLSVATDDAGTGKITGVEAGDYFWGNQEDASKIPTTGPHTTSGLGLGSSVTQIASGLRNPTTVEAYPAFPAHYYVETEPNGNWINFAVLDSFQKASAVGVWKGAVPPGELCN